MNFYMSHFHIQIVFQTLFEHYDEQYFKKWFCIQNAESDLTRLFEKLALS